MRSAALRSVMAAAGAMLGPMLGLWAATIATPARAHPHVWVTVETTVVYDAGKVTGLRHKWTFDDMYTAMAIQGLDANEDGTYSREELAELTKVNMDGLKEFAYFTVPKLGKEPLKTKDPSDAYLEYKDNLLSLYFTLPLEQPVPADKEGFNFAVFDESFFIAFEFGKTDPIKLSGAPTGCHASVGIPQSELAQFKSLNESFGGQLSTGDQNAGTGMGYAQTVTLGCKKS